MSEVKMPREYWLKIKLLEPTIISESSATVGGHRCLDYLPGRLFLGVTARIYAALGDAAWTVFHSGAVRFLDAYLFDEQEIALARPMPLSLHTIKGEVTEEQAEATKRFYNLASPEHQPDPRAQYQQRRDHYLFVDKASAQPGVVRGAQVEHQTFWKTAMEPKSGSRPREAHLFQYEAIRAGYAFATRVQVDAQVDESLDELLLDVLLGEQVLGRARSAEFGKALITRLGTPPNTGRGRPESTDLEAFSERLSGQKSALIYLTADLALLNAELGTVRLEPEAADFGFPDNWSVDPGASFLRFRSYDRFNSFQRTHEIQRQVLSRGSVIVLRADQALSEAEIGRVFGQQSVGVGLERQEGLGQFEVQPEWLLAPMIAAAREADGSSSASAEALSADEFFERISPDDQQLLRFLQARSTPQLREDEEALIVEALESIGALYARREPPFGDGELQELPGKSQWGNLRNWARLRRGRSFEPAEFIQALSGTHGQLEKGWEQPGPDADRSLAEWISGRIAQYQDSERQNLVLAELSRLMRHHIQQNYQQLEVR